MKQSNFFPFAIVAIAAAAGKGEDIKTQWTRDVVFGKGGSQELKLDMVSPAGKGPFPAIVVVHGGGWRAGSYRDKSMQIIADRLAKHGYVAACIQYRLVPTARYPSQIEDCKCAVRWLRADARKLNIDPEHIGAIGGSAGGHLVLLLGLTGKSDGLEGAGDLTPDQAQQSSAVQAVVNLFGPTDLENGDWDKRVEPLVVGLLGGPIAEKAELARKGSPVTYIHKKPAPPPILTFHGTVDPVVPFVHATKLHDRLKKVGATEKLVQMKGAGHGWAGTKLDDTIKQSAAFFDEHLKAKKPMASLRE